MSGMQKASLTPLMQQYVDLKNQFEDALLLFQVGDFYELFFQDAIKASSFLGIALTKRGNVGGDPIPLCGFPMHAVDHYIPKLVRGGFKVALCQQLEEAVAGKMVKRGVTQVFTPGTLTSELLLDAKSPSYIMTFFPGEQGWSVVFCELMTSSLYATLIPADSMRQVETELFRFLPDEVVMAAQKGASRFSDFFKSRGFFLSVEQLSFEDAALEELHSWYQGQFTQDQVDFITKHQPLDRALYVWHSFLKKNQTAALSSFSNIQFYEPDEFLQLDPATLKNLDIVKNSFDGSTKHTLYSFLDVAVTGMGSRLLKSWLLHPLVDKELILHRQDGVKLFTGDYRLLVRVRQLLERCGDVERVVGRIALSRSVLKDYVMLAQALYVVVELAGVLPCGKASYVDILGNGLIDLSALADLLSKACNDDFELSYTIKKGYDAQLDLLRDLVENSSQKVLELERQEQQNTGISSLKIRSNGVQGYYIEITKTHAASVPAHYIRQQTLVGKERYTIGALQDLQIEIIQAQKNIDVYEKELFADIKEQVFSYVSSLRQISQSLAQLDVVACLAQIAYEKNYVAPVFHEEQDIIIKQGRHPVIADQLKTLFIANDTTLTSSQALWIVTGPNMGGKSTYLRQVALICLLAQIGSFVPAKQSSLPVLDRIFTRIGAGDHLAEGKSTFLVEMEETAQICLQATNKSLVILDEVGRGTSTYDGLALAQAIVEHLHTVVKARCLFATHYHELTQLSDTLPGVVSYFMSSKRTADGIIFLHQIVPGRADGSFGIEVAKIAALPKPIINRAQELLTHLESTGVERHGIVPAQKTIFEGVLDAQGKKINSIVQALEELDINQLSPKQAFDLLWILKEKLDE